MNYVFALIVPLIFLLSFLYAAIKKVKIYDSFCEGVKKAPPLILFILFTIEPGACGRGRSLF